MAMSALPTSGLSSLEAMLHSLMRGSGSGTGGGAGGGDDDDTPIDDTLASPPPAPLPARPTPRGRHPSRPRRRVRVQVAGPSESPPSPLPARPTPRGRYPSRPWRRVRVHVAGPSSEPPPPLPSSPSPSPSPTPTTIEEDARMATVVMEELERKAVEVEAQLKEKEEENAALKRRIESYHIRWLEYEIRIKSLEEAFHQQMAALQMAQDAARMAEETAYDRRGSSESHTVETAAEDPPVRLWHGRDRLSSVGGRRSAVGRLGSEFRRQSRTLERAVSTPDPGRPWQPAAPAANSADDLKRLKAQFRAWAKDYKARLRRAQAEIGRDRRRRGSGCWI